MEKLNNSLTELLSSRQRKLYSLVIAGIIIVYLFLTIGAAATKSPWCDEAWFASPAFNLTTKGFMGTTVLEPSGTWLEGIDKYTYWIPPGYILAQNIWYEIFGFSLISMRALSAAFGLLALFSWFFFVKVITGEVKTAILAFAFIALDYCFVMTASVGRMDMMSAAFNVAAFAAYMRLRERNVTQALLLGNILTAISVFTHPTGVLGFAGLFFLTLYFDWKKIKWWHPAIAAVPYLIGAGLWGIYIYQSPSLFLSQFGGNVNGIHQTSRLAGLTSLWTSLSNEITTRYLGFYGFSSDSSGIARFKIFILITYIAGITAAVFTSSIRRHKGYRGLLLLTALYFLMLLVLDGHKQVMYLVHIIPMFAVVLAVSVHWFYSYRILPRWLLTFGIFCLLTLQLGGVLYIIAQNDYRKTYLPVIRFLKTNSETENNLIMGSAELGFGVEFSDNFIDDWRLGFYSGKKPDLIVVGKQYEGMFNGLRSSEPETYRHVIEVLSREYHQVYDYNSVKVFKRKQPLPVSGE